MMTFGDHMMAAVISSTSDPFMKNLVMKQHLLGEISLDMQNYFPHYQLVTRCH